MNGKRLFLALLVMAGGCILSGCSLAGFWLSGWGGEDADLVVINDSPLIVDSISLEGAEHSRSLSDGRGFALLERGESFGLKLEEGEEQVLVTLWDQDGTALASARVEWKGERTFLTLDEAGKLTEEGS